ncbi:hypothetical protein BDB01DRAFT_587325 [Pilobolus umbonatus]|nr:hypothetical protein BDB01DRAFT_587325 [Pilobolus umbonatus]
MNSRGYPSFMYHPAFYPVHSTQYDDCPTPTTNKTQLLLDQSRPIFDTMKRIVWVSHRLAYTLHSTMVSIHTGYSALIYSIHQLHILKKVLIQHKERVLSFLRWIKKRQSNKHAFSVAEFQAYCLSETSSRSIIQLPTLLYLSCMFIIPYIIYITSQKNTPPLISYNTSPKHPKQSYNIAAEKVNRKGNDIPCPPQVEFARAIFPFKAEYPREISLQSNELVAILSKETNDWWKGRLRDGKIGYFPANHVRIIKKES